MAKTQYDVLMDHFRNRGSISGVEAQLFFRIRALPRRIKDLEERGHMFDRVQSKDPTGQRYVRYFYRGARGARAVSPDGVVYTGMNAVAA